VWEEGVSFRRLDAALEENVEQKRCAFVPQACALGGLWGWVPQLGWCRRG
jgi:hypothetical protein